MVDISIVTAFPDIVKTYAAASILGRGVKSGRLKINVVDIRDHAAGPHRQIDDYSFGGEGGMVLMAEPLDGALDSIAPKSDRYVLFPSPQGVPLYQELVEDLYRRSGRQKLVIVCGHYEGVDERFCENSVDLEVSLGDFVLTGGELPALAITDAIARLEEGVVGKKTSVSDDSFYKGLLDCPHYTRPADYRGMLTPEVLLGGNRALIEEFRRSEAVQRTLARRPDLLSRAGIGPYLSKGVYVILAHHPVCDRSGNLATTAITGLDLHDISRASRTYGIKRFLVVTPLDDQKEMIGTIVEHWTKGYGAAHNPDRAEAMKLVKTSKSVRLALDYVAKREKAEPLTVVTTAKEDTRAIAWNTLKGEMLESGRPTVLIFGTGSGLHSSLIDSADYVLAPITGCERYNHLSVRSAVGIVLDRLLGFR